MINGHLFIFYKTQCICTFYLHIHLLLFSLPPSGVDFILPKHGIIVLNPK